MLASFRNLLLASLLLGLAPSAAAVTVCAGTGELCVTANAAAPGTTNADTVQASYAVSSTVVTQLNAGDAHSCGVIFAQGFSTRAGAGCASENQRRYAFVQEYPAASPGPCVGTQVHGWCAAPGVSGDCAGAWLVFEGSSTATWRTVACSAMDMAGACVTDTAFTSINNACSGAKTYAAACPNGVPGTQVSVVVANGEVKVLCVGTAAPAALP